MVPWDSGCALRLSTPTGVDTGRVWGRGRNPRGPSVRTKGLVTETKGCDQARGPDVGHSGNLRELVGSLGARPGHERQGQP